MVTPPYFFGVRDSFEPIQENAFATQGWLNHCRALIQSWKQWPPSPLFAAPKHFCEPVRRILEIYHMKERIRILDLGGGFGDNFFYLKRALGGLTDKIEYHVVDNKLQCDLGRDFYGSDNKTIKFHESIPHYKYDLTLLIGTLQYIDEWRNTVREVMKITADSIFISRSPIRIDGPTFITIQSVCPARGPSSLRKIGEANVAVIRESELDNLLQNNSFKIKTSVLHENYSRNFSRLPELYRNVMYIDKHYLRGD